MFFESQKSIDKFLDDLGIFINEDGELFVKTSKNDCRKVNPIL